MTLVLHYIAVHIKCTHKKRKILQIFVVKFYVSTDSFSLLN